MSALGVLAETRRWNYFFRLAVFRLAVFFAVFFFAVFFAAFLAAFFFAMVMAPCALRLCRRIGILRNKGLQLFVL